MMIIIRYLAANLYRQSYEIVRECQYEHNMSFFNCTKIRGCRLTQGSKNVASKKLLYSTLTAVAIAWRHVGCLTDNGNSEKV